MSGGVKKDTTAATGCISQPRPRLARSSFLGRQPIDASIHRGKAVCSVAPVPCFVVEGGRAKRGAPGLNGEMMMVRARAAARYVCWVDGRGNGHRQGPSRDRLESRQQHINSRGTGKAADPIS